MQDSKRNEDNHIQPLKGQEAIRKMQELAKEAGSCFFCTRLEAARPFDARPMAIQKVDDEGNFWFLSDKNSLKNQELKEDDHVQLLYSKSGYNGFVSVFGRARISQDRDKIRDIWSPEAKIWFQGGVDDPAISVIQVIPTEGYYWDTKHGGAVAFAKMALSLVTGQTMDDGVEGKLVVKNPAPAKASASASAAKKPAASKAASGKTAAKPAAKAAPAARKSPAGKAKPASKS